ncbi:unnamed protein product [Diamesa hyperborea]
MADYGYDISDYRDIHHEFGTLKDFDALLAECKAQGIKLILDLVPNHTSEEHEWFKKSERREPGYENYYIWHPGTFDAVTGEHIPPTNWLSTFRYSAWTWSPIRNQFYFHAFLKEQPDLNYRNGRVVQEMKNVILFWLKKGIEGFRIDAVPYMFEVNADPKGNYPDELPMNDPNSNNPNCQDKDDYCYLIHSYTQDQPETYDMIFQWRQLMTDFVTKSGGETKVIMTEAYTSLENMVKFYGDGIRNGANVPFNFELISNVNIQSTAKDYKTRIDNWLTRVPKGSHANWVLGNHDQHRLASRLGVERGDLLNIMLQTLPGIAITYQGEELVMTNVNISWADTLDPQACHTNPEIYHQNSRDPARTPFPWDDTKNAGFSTADKTWLPVGTNYLTVNVKAQQTATNSHLKIFMKLTTLRKQPVLRTGTYQGVLSNSDNVFMYKREVSGSIAIVILNFGTSIQNVNIQTSFPTVPAMMKVYTSSMDSGLTDGQDIATTNIPVKSNHGVVLLSV